MVRYGNVIGSRGSVVDLYRKLINDGASSLPITDPRMTRFWVTLQQGVDFVLSSLKMMRGGEIFVPKIPSLKMVDLAHFMAPGLQHQIVGIRPGEKLHEVMVTIDDARSTVALKDRFIIEPSLIFWSHKSHRSAESTPVDDEFHYSSDTNSEWIDGAGFAEYLKESSS